MIEEGTVVEISNGTARVKAAKSQSCQGCISRGICVAGSGGEMIVEVTNRKDAVVGDRVIREVSSKTFIKSSFLAYIVPVISLLAGAAIGTGLSATYPELGGADNLSAGFGTLFFVISIIVLFSMNKTFARKEYFRPIIKTILS